MYYILYYTLYLISLLPFRVLYILSDLLYLILFRVFKYRKVITISNLQRSFPEKSVQEIENICKKFYINLCDSIVETVKLLSISQEELAKRNTVNWDVLSDAYATGRVAQAHLSHLFNWEWGTVLCNWKTDYHFTGIYNPISNKTFDRLMNTIRTRSGTIMIEMDNMLAEMGHYQEKNTLWGFVADQNPSEQRRGVWVDFLNQKTVFFKGPELVARRYNNIVIFGRIIKLKRGYYTIELVKVFDEGAKTKEGEITHAYAKFLEESIRQQPENWVWSHRRWKHQYPNTK